MNFDFLHSNIDFQLMSAIKTGKIAHSRFDQLAQDNASSQSNAYGGKMERSGGGI